MGKVGNYGGGESVRQRIQEVESRKGEKMKQVYGERECREAKKQGLEEVGNRGGEKVIWRRVKQGRGEAGT